MTRGEPVIVTALRIEASAVRAGTGPRVVSIGVGPTKARGAIHSLSADDPSAVVVAGFGGALDDGLAPGDVVVADRVVGPDEQSFDCAHEALAEALRDAGLSVTVAAISSQDHIVSGDERARVGRSGARAVEMESYFLRPLSEGRAFSVVRVIVDTPSNELGPSLTTLRGGLRAHRSLKRVGAVLRHHLEAG